MAMLGVYPKQPRETQFYTLEYNCWLDATIPELLTGTPTVFVSPTTAPALVVTPLIQNNTQVRLTVAGGVDGTKYKLEVLVDTDAGQIKEDELYIKVVDQ